jgi:hypothetical protein
MVIRWTMEECIVSSFIFKSRIQEEIELGE